MYLLHEINSRVPVDVRVGPQILSYVDGTRCTVASRASLRPGLWVPFMVEFQGPGRSLASDFMTFRDADSFPPDAVGHGPSVLGSGLPDGRPPLDPGPNQVCTSRFQAFRLRSRRPLAHHLQARARGSKVWGCGAS